MPPFGPQENAPLFALWLGLPGLALLGMAFAGQRSKKARLRLYLSWGLLLAFLVLQAACAGGLPPERTPTGGYTITVTGVSGTAQHSGGTTLVVQ